MGSDHNCPSQVESRNQLSPPPNLWVDPTPRLVCRSLQVFLLLPWYWKYVAHWNGPAFAFREDILIRKNCVKPYRCIQLPHDPPCVGKAAGGFQKRDAKLLYLGVKLITIFIRFTSPFLTILIVRIFLFLMLTCHSIIKSTSSLWFISSPLWMTIINISVQILTSISSVLCLNILPTYKITSSPTLIIKSIPSYPVIWLATALNTVQDWEAKFSCKKMFSLLCYFLLRLRLTLSQIFSKRFVHCIAGKAQVGIVISDLEVKPKQPEQ